MDVKNKTAVITGAGHGIGRAIAYALARRGCHLALADINPAGLEETAARARQWGVRVSTHVMDVTDRAAAASLPARVAAAHGEGADLLVNNAGVAVGGAFEQVPEADFDWVLEVNFHAVVRLTRAFLPHFKRRSEARIVNISSVFGLVAPAEQTAYSASKFAVRGFSNALRHELAGTNVGVTVVHPGGVATAIARNARIAPGIPEAEVQEKMAAQERLLRMPPERAGEIIVRGIERRRARILVGLDAWVISVVERLMPVGYWSVMQRLTALRGGKP